MILITSALTAFLAGSLALGEFNRAFPKTTIIVRKRPHPFTRDSLVAWATLVGLVLSILAFVKH
jgi:hypothetical protein